MKSKCQGLNNFLIIAFLIIVLAGIILRLFLDSELKVTNIASRIGTHRNYIADCLKTHEGCSFNQYVNRFRIDYAKRLLHYHPEKKIATISLESGFANETSFYRTFKAIVGMTPKEWLASTKKKS